MKTTLIKSHRATSAESRTAALTVEIDASCADDKTKETELHRILSLQSNTNGLLLQCVGRRNGGNKPQAASRANARLRKARPIMSGTSGPISSACEQTRVSVIDASVQDQRQFNSLSRLSPMNVLLLLLVTFSSFGIFLLEGGFSVKMSIHTIHPCKCE